MKIAAFLSALFLVYTAASARADVRVAFIEFYTPDGKLIQLEPGGRFAHVAISYKRGWLHAHPYRGVEWISEENLAKMGKIAEVLRVSGPDDLPEKAVAQFLGKPYDTNFSWSDDRIYCSELVAKLLGIPPEPMHFDPKLWPEQYWKYEGLPGISPDKVYARLARP